MISAWSSVQKLVLAARAVDEKSNAITAIPELLELLAIKGAIVTIDAMGRQTRIAGKIVDKGADYVLGLKANQGSLRDDVELLFTGQSARGFADVAVSKASSVDGDHGRIETREVYAVEDIAWLKERHPDWKGLRSVVMVVAQRETAKGEERERRFHISSLPADADKVPPSALTGVSRTACTGCSTCSSATTTAVSEERTPPPTSPPSSAPPSTRCAGRPARTASNPSASPDGTRISSPGPSPPYDVNSFDSPARSAQKLY